MLILGLDTTTRAGSIAVVREGVVVLERSGDGSRTHGQRLPGEIMLACREAGVGIHEIELFAVAAGPGSFTGLRIGIAATQGLAMAHDRRIVAVGSLEAIAVASGHDGSVCVWMDAQRGEVFAQVFAVSGSGPGARVTMLSDAVALPPADALEAHRGWLEAATFHGDGAVRYRDEILARRGPTACVSGAVPPLAGAVARIAARAPERAVVPHAVVPVYVRRPDAELARERRSSP